MFCSITRRWRSLAMTTTPSVSFTHEITSSRALGAGARDTTRDSTALDTNDYLRDIPVPAPDRRTTRGIGDAARRLVELRDGWLNPPGLDPAELEKRTLTNLYNERPTWLEHAHATLDGAVFAAYGWPPDVPDDDILGRLLALNLEREAA